MTLYAIGDVHGCVVQLARQFTRIAADAQRLGLSRPRVVLLGDYVDRGIDSKGVLDLLTGPEWSERFDLVPLLGNHEAMLMSAIRGTATSGKISLWAMHHGGAETLESYGADFRHHGLGDFLRHVNDWMPPEHITFLESLPPSWREPGLFFSHAGIDPDRPLDDQATETLLYGKTSMFEFDPDQLAPCLRKRLGVRLVHGHWRNRNGIVVLPHRIGIDTGAGYPDGILSTVAIIGDEVRVLTSESGAC